MRRVEDLLCYLRALGRVAVAFSSGVDSGFLLFMARKALGRERVLSLYGNSPIRAGSSLGFAKYYSESLGLRLRVVETGEFFLEDFLANDARRCYVCKRELYRVLGGVSRSLGFWYVLDGTLVDDLERDRPGLRAVKEEGVLTPLLYCGFCKGDVVELSRSFSLPVWRRPPDSCLATRVPRGRRIEPLVLKKVERAEEALRLWGMKSFRVRDYGKMALLEVRGEEPPRGAASSLFRLGYLVVVVVRKAL